MANIPQSAPIDNGMSGIPSQESENEEVVSEKQSEFMNRLKNRIASHHVDIPPVVVKSYNILLITSMYEELFNDADTIEKLNNLESRIERELKTMEQDRRAAAYHSEEVIRATALSRVSNEYPQQKRESLANGVVNQWKQSELDRVFLEAWYENLRGKIRSKTGGAPPLWKGDTAELIRQYMTQVSGNDAVIAAKILSDWTVLIAKGPKKGSEHTVDSIAGLIRDGRTKSRW